MIFLSYRMGLSRTIQVRVDDCTREERKALIALFDVFEQMGVYSLFPFAGAVLLGTVMLAAILVSASLLTGSVTDSTFIAAIISGTVGIWAGKLLGGVLAAYKNEQAQWSIRDIIDVYPRCRALVDQIRLEQQHDASNVHASTTPAAP